MKANTSVAFNIGGDVSFVKRPTCSVACACALDFRCHMHTSTHTHTGKNGILYSVCFILYVFTCITFPKQDVHHMHF